MANKYDWVKPEELADRFWLKVEKLGPDECWPWRASLNECRYGEFWVGAKGRGAMVSASRTALAITLGRWPQHALHSCDNPPCCNPAHLREGTHAENMADKKARGRVRFGPRRKDHIPNAKLTDADLWQIICRYGDGEKQSVIADSMGVSRSLVNMIVKGRIWQKEVAAMFCVG